MPRSASIEVQVKSGTRKIERVAAKLRKQNAREVRSVLRHILVKASKGSRKAIRRSAIDVLPKSGGLGRWTAILPRATVKDSLNGVLMLLTMGRPGHDYKGIDAGDIRHPVFGNRNVWRYQHVTPNFFTDSTKREGPKIREELAKSIKDYVRDVERQMK